MKNLTLGKLQRQKKGWKNVCGIVNIIIVST